MQAAAGAGHNGNPEGPITIQGLASQAATDMRPPRRHRRRPTSQDSVRHLTSKSSTARPVIRPRERRPPPTPTTPTRCCYSVGCWFLRRGLCVYVHDEADQRHLEEKTQKQMELIELQTKEKLARLAARSARPALANLNSNPAPTQADNTRKEKKEATPKAEAPAPVANAPARTPWSTQSLQAPVPKNEAPLAPPQPQSPPKLGVGSQWRAKHPTAYRTEPLYNRKHKDNTFAVKAGSIITATEIVYGDSGDPYPEDGYRFLFIRANGLYLPIRKHHCNYTCNFKGTVDLFEQVSGDPIQIDYTPIQID